ncbi:SIR2 family protein [Cellulosimicrobium cellulans]|uniref:SIR2 family protein n=1 Tax=Cellulosimicrobium cellulans TaxID=1710 RepID=UPI0009D9370F|nr:SIR2 family protein [Cellulosimicrobium cellulans]
MAGSKQGSVVRLGADDPLHPDGSGALTAVEVRRVEAWLAALLQTEHLSLLIGNGLSAAAGSMAGKLPPLMSRHISEDEESPFPRIREYAKESAQNVGRDVNLEDEIRAAMMLADGLAVLGNPSKEGSVRAAIETAMSGLLDEVLDFEKNIWEHHQKADPEALKVARALTQFLGPFVARPAQRDRLNLFTTNYDRLLEYAADVLGLHLLDRFEGRLHPKFSASRVNLDMHYSPPGVRGEPRLVDGVARYAKLHGSIDWSFARGEIWRDSVPFGGPRTNSESVANAVIYPNPAKDVETLAYPYSELFRDFAAAVCRPNTTLVTFGYGFGDSHINRVIADMLRVPSTHLVVVSRDPLSALDSFKARTLFPASQTTELVGPDVGGLEEFSSLLPTITSDRILEAQFEYLNKRSKLGDELDPKNGGDEEP